MKPLRLMKLPRLNIFLSVLLLAFPLLFLGCDVQGLFGEDGVGEDLVSGEQLVIAYAEAPTSYSPLTYDSVNKKYLANVYEPLLTYDKTFNFKTGLAVSWGRSDDLTWEFRLREGVIFHDGSEFDIDDAIYSLEMAKFWDDSELSSLLENIDFFEATDTGRLRIVTKDPDPLLLHKLTNIYMISDGFEDFNSLLGTGPYLLVDFAENDLVLQRFDDYWGDVPYFQEVILSYVPDADKRLDGVLDGSVDFLANVPPQYTEDMLINDMRLVEVPSLEVSFLMFNLNGPFGNDDLRSAVWHSIPTFYADVFGGGYLKTIAQYAASGIFGSSAKVQPRQIDLELATEYRANYLGDVSVTLDLPLGLEVVGARIAEDLSELDIDVTVNVMDVSSLEEKILAGESEFYFFGWRYDLADASDFFVSVVHSRDEAAYGEFNGIAYSDESVDSLIEELVITLEDFDRRLLFSQLTEHLDADQVIMPLFESKLLYAVSDGLIWSTRLDGQVLASEIAGIVLE